MCWSGAGHEFAPWPAISGLGALRLGTSLCGRRPRGTASSGEISGWHRARDAWQGRIEVACVRLEWCDVEQVKPMEVAPPILMREEDGAV